MYTYRNTATMKYIDFKILFCSFLFFVSSSTVAQTIDSDSVVYYLYDHVKENQGSGNAWEDRIIELVYRGDSVSGCMWGTSDEFQGAREGYYPGHYVIGLKDVRICGDSIFFILDSRGERFFSNPVDVDIHTSAEAKERGWHDWTQDPRSAYAVVPCRGYISGDTIVMKEVHVKMQHSYDDFYSFCGDMLFVRTSLDSVRRIDRRMSPEDEKMNRKSGVYDRE